LPLKEKFKSLLMAEYQSANYTVEQLKVIQIQIKLD
jgi:hypothetical protein